MTERTIVTAIARALRRHGAVVVITTGVSTAGTPDLVGCYAGRAFALEVKTRRGKPTPLQTYRLAEWRTAGAHAQVVRSVDEALKAVGVELGVQVEVD